METVTFRAVSKADSRVRLPEALDEWARCKAARERTSFSSIVAEALSIMKGDDPAAYGIKPKRRKMTAPQQQA